MDSYSNTSTNRYITDTNDIYVFFELIRMYNAKSVLDVGMLLARCGALSRQVKDAVISQDVRLYGIPLYLDILPVHTKMYNLISSLSALYEDTDVFFDIVFIIDVDDLFWKADGKRLIQFLFDHSSRIIISDDSKDLHAYLQKLCPLTPITVDGSKYIMIG